MKFRTLLFLVISALALLILHDPVIAQQPPAQPSTNQPSTDHSMTTIKVSRAKSCCPSP